jgi:glycosyltransferase involved in cell wall biosynthesis
MEPIKISLIIPTCNRVDMLRRALVSVLAQENCGSFEVIVVDDGSTDETVAMVRSEFPAVRLLQQDHKGAPAARNLGIQHARGCYLALLDDDDELMPDSLAVRMKALDENLSVDMVCADYQNYVKNCSEGPSAFGYIQIHTICELADARAGLLLCRNFFDAQLRRPISSTITLMFRRSSVQHEEMVFDEALLMGQDWEFALRYSIRRTIGLLPVVVAKRHCHGANMARQRERCAIGQILLDRKVLAWSVLTPEQRVFMRKRLDEDLFESAYYFSTKRGRVLTALKYWCASCMHGLTAKKIRLLARCLFKPKVASRMIMVCLYGFGMLA